MARYKISKENINEFFGLFGKKKKPEELKKIIQNDPTLQKLDKEIGDINAKYSKSIKGNKTFMALAKKYGVEVK
jgi:hypothetical protein